MVDGVLSGVWLYSSDNAPLSLVLSIFELNVYYFIMGGNPTILAETESFITIVQEVLNALIFLISYTITLPV